MNDVVSKIYQLIAQSGIKKNELAEKIGVSKNTIQYWKKENAYPSLPVIEKICDVFGITAEQFFSGIDNPDSQRSEQKFIEGWRLLTDKEKRVIESVIETFRELKGTSHD